ncbi:MAG TPA: phage head closure protein [Amaricoccus sp.]|uniref:phage head closure protein n=1 Tax=Amaricoccus sp. TaxID=1872485 RepID=UPI002C8E538E|nr:phage head closure protein [Amaricoccus sp.]HMR51191.1 phage head closure protein [Amaricoccus sp.]HMT98061.1 phage head closure protein [Amaricoccus sp.]
MEAGSLDRRITFLRAVESTDALGGVVQDWMPQATVWAAVLPVSDGERWRAGEVGASVTTRFQVRWSPQAADFGPLDRIEFDGRSYDIAGVKEIGRREGLEFTASARAE